MNDITQIFNRLIEQAGSIDIAEAEFKRMINEDDELRATYREWCDSVGSSERDGFFDYCEELHDSQSDIWESLNDYDE